MAKEWQRFAKIRKLTPDTPQYATEQATWFPGKPAKVVDPIPKALRKALDKLTPEARAELLSGLKSI